MASDDIAIIGIAFKLPGGVDDESKLWDVLSNGTNVMTELPKSRLNIDSFYDADISKTNKLHARGAHFLRDDPGSFDAPFFSITAREAAAMDPQQRLMLEVSYHAFENAGIPISKVKGSRTAVFSASFSDDYSRIIDKDPDNFPPSFITGTALSILANRISWYFDLLGPSVQLDTACSSSLVAIDMACQCLRNGDASTALVNGSSLFLGPERFTQLSNLGFLSPDSVCYSFDHRANGYARGEGIISLVLKPVSEAINDGDMIRAVIRSSGSNQDGKTPSLTQPNGSSQEALIRRVYEKAGIDFESTRYIEAHGTGTSMGDVIEMKAIGEVFRPFRSRDQPLLVGSLKTNFGHLEACSGLAAVLKTVTILEKGIIPPNALLEKINPELNTEHYNTTVPFECTSWPGNGLRRVSVNSFGFGGTNAHIVVDDAHHYLQARSLRALCRTMRPSQPNGCLVGGINGSPTKKQPLAMNHFISTGGNNNAKHRELVPTNGNDTSEIGHQLKTTKFARYEELMVWSAPDEKSLKRVVQAYDDYHQARALSHDYDISSLAYTLASRRSEFPWRTFSIVNQDFSTKPRSFPTVKPVRASYKRSLAFVFTGQGAQYTGMGFDLFRYPVFMDTMKNIDLIYSNLGCDWSIHDQLQKSSDMDQPDISQTLTTALQISLIELLKSLGIVPDIVIGHSSGEIAAAYSIGSISLESACKLSFYRGKVARKLCNTTSCCPGSMMSVNLPHTQVDDYLNNSGLVRTSELQIACINSSLNSTLAGREEIIDALQKQLEDDGIFAQKLRTKVAYHSSAMQSVADEYFSLVGSLEAGDLPDNPTTLMMSSLSSQLVDAHTLLNPQYWVDNMVKPVNFLDAVQNVLQVVPAVSDFVEVGPHAALKRPVLDIIKGSAKVIGGTKHDIRYNSVLHKSKGAGHATLEFLGTMFCNGYPVSIPTKNEQYGEKGLIPFLVDCPRYPFDHSHRYWIESRFSTDFRLREAVSSDTLGLRVSDWNPLEPRWRKCLSLTDSPWIGDHVISDTILLPGMGMIVMALEAVKQMCPPKRTIIGYHIKEAHFLNAVVISKSPDEQTELVTCLRPLQREYEKESLWSHVNIFTYKDKQWSECFRAIIRVEYEDLTNHMDQGIEKSLAHSRILAAYEDATISCTKPIDKESLYKNFAVMGTKFGRRFRLLDKIFWNGKDESIAYADISGEIYKTTSLVHPAVLDSAVQNLLMPNSKRPHGTTTMIPHKLFDGWVSASGWQHPQNRLLRHLSKSNVGQRGQTLDSSLCVIGEDNSILCEISKFLVKSIGNYDMDLRVDQNPLYGISWKPQLSLLDREQLEQLTHARSFTKDEPFMLAYRRRLNSALNKALRITRSKLSDADMQNVPADLVRYVSWMDHHIDKIPIKIDDDKTETALESEFRELQELYPPFKIFSVVAHNLLSILRGDTDPLALVFDTGSAEALYADVFDTISDNRFAAFLQLLIHETPNLKILEVGAGTGGWTRRVIATLHQLEQQTGANAFCGYTYTDISAAFFPKASQQLQEFEGRMDFRTLDLEKPVDVQGFEPEAYDLVIAGSVLHATSDLTATTRNIRRLLKPGGRFINVEITCPEKVETNFAFGLLPGWWLCNESWRSLSPGVDEQRWDKILKDSGFSGNDIVLRDHESDVCHDFSLIVSTAVTPRALDDQLSPTKNPHILLVVDPQSSEQTKLAAKLEDELLSPLGLSVRVSAWRNLPPPDMATTGIAICLVEVGKPLLAQLSEIDFESVKAMTKHLRKVLWVTCCSVCDKKYPHYGPMQGFFRTLRSEASENQLVTLAIELRETEDRVETCATSIHKVFKASFHSEVPELEYITRDGKIMSGRLVAEKGTSEKVRSLTSPEIKKQSWSTGLPLKLAVRTPGLLDTMELVEDTVHRTELGPEEIEIEAKAWGLSFRDIFVAVGRLEGDELGVDCSGVVTRLGSSCSNLSIQAGDRVCMCSLGCMRAYPRAPASMAVKIPESLSFEAAASMVNPGVTAFYCLIEIARLKKGESILIHSASGSTGQMAVRLAKMIGATIFATVGSDTKKLLLIEKFGIPDNHIFYSRNTSFAEGVKRMTNGHGVDVVLNSLSGDGLTASWNCLSPLGRFVEIGKSDIISNSPLPMAGFARNISFHAVDIWHLAQLSPSLCGQLLRGTMDLIARGAIQTPSPLHIYPVTEVEKAFRFIQSGKNTGRIVISIDPSKEVQKPVRQESAWRFDDNASYVISGGLGGLGRTIIRWMVEKGARNLIILSRTGPSTEKRLEIISELTKQGINFVAPKCDVSSKESLQKTLGEFRDGLPPIKGCINASMVLQDAIFENMTYHQWMLSIRSKIDTSWNLHQVLPHDMDFFVQLSSLAGIYGSISQSNYAAGCAFQDSLARYRISRGQKAVSLDLGWMHTSGIIAENELYQRQREHAADMRKIDDAEFLALLDIYCDPSLSLPSESNGQLLVGVYTPADQLAMGFSSVGPAQRRPLFSGFSETSKHKGQSVLGEETQDLVRLFKMEVKPEERAAILAQALADRLAHSLNISPEDVDHSKPLSQYGVDSLMAIELRNWINEDFKARVSVFEIMNGGTDIAAIGDLVTTRTELVRR